MMLSSGLVGLIGFVNLAKALAIQANSAISAEYGHYATYTVANTNISFELHSLGYTGQPSVVTLDLSNFHEKYFPIHTTSMNETFKLEERDVCGLVADCAQSAADSVTTAAVYLANTGPRTALYIYAVARHYWTDNDYANTKSVLQQAVVGFVINLATTPIGNAFINSRSTVTPGNDECNIADVARTADFYANSLYDFCAAIQSARKVQANTEFYNGEFSIADGAVEDGKVAVTRNFIASQAGTFGPTCAGLGISWKRSIFARSMQYLGLEAM